MKRFLLLIVFALVAQYTYAQISVADFYLATNDLTANTHGTEQFDQNGERCALIKIETTYKGFAFNVGSLGITKVEEDHVGEVWVYVPHGVRRITIQHAKLGTLRDYYFPVNIASGRTYILKLTTGTIYTHVEQAVTQQFVVFNVTPKEAMVSVNDVPWPVMDGIAEKLLEFGKYQFRVECPNYHPTAGVIEVNDPNNKIAVNVELKPAFGWLRIEGNDVVSQSSIYVDNMNGSSALTDNYMLKSGKHVVHIVHPLYKPFEQNITIADGETLTLKPQLVANFSRVTLKVDADAEIWVNGEKKGVRSWTGDMEAKTYTIECRLKNHRPTRVQQVITNSMSGETINLSAPFPINGRLTISSTPSKAKVYIDDKHVGETPIQINSILIGEHKVVLDKQGCAPLTKNITIEEGKTLTLSETLQTGRVVTIRTDREGDDIYVDGNLMGKSPLQTSLGFGKHSVAVVRGNRRTTKPIEVLINGGTTDFQIVFGKLIQINTNVSGAQIFDNGILLGSAPLTTDLQYGQHKLMATSGKLIGEKMFNVETNGASAVYIKLRKERFRKYAANGLNFVMATGSYASVPALGLRFGSGKILGWYGSLTTGTFFGKPVSHIDNNGVVLSGSVVDAEIVDTKYFRYTATAGIQLKVAAPVYIYGGVGYSQRNMMLVTEGGEALQYDAHCFEGFTYEAGLTLHMRGWSIGGGYASFGGYSEVQVGVGYNWKKK